VRLADLLSLSSNQQRSMKQHWQIVFFLLRYVVARWLFALVSNLEWYLLIRLEVCSTFATDNVNSYSHSGGGDA
jgi:hypothetical protein